MRFPEAVVEAAIRDEISAAIQDRPPTGTGWRPEVDSQVVIRVVLRIEAEIGVELPEEVMPPGGFDDVEECVRGILAQSRRLWVEKTARQRETIA